MEQIKKVAEQVMKQSGKLLQKNLELILQSGEVSIYNDTLSTPCVINNIARIKAAFHTLPEDFYRIFSQRIIDCEFTDQRLTDSVNHVIDTCVYPTPTIAQFISFDKKYKVFTYDEMLKKTDELGSEVWKSYKSIDLPGIEKPIYAHINDIKKYNLKVKT